MDIAVSEHERPMRVAAYPTMASTGIDDWLTFPPVRAAIGVAWAWDVRPTGLLRLLSRVTAVVGGWQERRI